MNIKGRKMFGYLLTNILIFIVAILIIIINAEMFPEIAMYIIGGFLVNLALLIFGNVLSKLFTPTLIKELLIKNV